MTRGSKLPTQDNTFLARNGLYYPEDKLESYFIGEYDDLSMIEKLKKFYSYDAEMFKELTYNKNPFLKMI